MSAQTSQAESDLDHLNPLDIIFNCSVCHDSIRDVYSGAEDNQGFSDGRHPGRSPVNKFWMTECGHLLCSKHFEGGVVPFHPEGGRSSVPCAECVRTSNDREPKQLFPIRGYQKNEYDSEIPSSFFDCPPPSLARKDMDDLQFHYMNLISYGKEMRKECREAQRMLAQTKDALDNETREKNQIQTQLQQSSDKVEDLEPLALKWQKWKQKEPMILHYLGVYNDMTREVEELRSALEQHGYQVSHRDYSYNPKKQKETTNHAPHMNLKSHAPLEDPSQVLPSSNIGGSSPDTLLGDDERNNNNRKRNFSQTDSDPPPHRDRSALVRGETINNMPPPKVPNSRSSPIKISASSHVYEKLPQSRIQADSLAIDTNPRQQYSQMADEGQLQTRAQIPAAHYTPRMSGALTPSNHSGEASHPIFIDQSRDMSNSVQDFGSKDDTLNFRPNLPLQAFSSPQRHDLQYQQVCKRDEETRRVRPYPILPEQYVRQSRATLPSPLSWSATAEARQNRQLISHAPARSNAPSSVARSFIARQAQNRSGRPYTPSPQKQDVGAPSVNPSISSPFFRSQSSSGQFEPRRSLYAEPVLEESAMPNINQGYHMPPLQRVPVQALPHQSQTLNGLSFIDNPYSMTDHEPLFERHPVIAYEYRPASTMPQTPRDTNGLFVRDGFRHDLSAPSSSHHFRPPQPLPSTQPSLLPGLYGSHSKGWHGRDGALDVVKGAKAAGTSHSFSRRRDENSTLSSGLPSNGRRSVRR